MATILIVDDEADVRETVEMILDYEGYQYKITNQVETTFFPAFRLVPAAM